MTTDDLLAALLAEVSALRGEVAALRAAMPDRLLSVAEVAAMAGVSPKTVYRRVNQGRLAPVPGRAGTYFLPEEVARAGREGALTLAP